MNSALFNTLFTLNLIALHFYHTMNNKFHSKGLSFAVVHLARVYSHTTTYLCIHTRMSYYNAKHPSPNKLRFFCDFFTATTVVVVVALFSSLSHSYICHFAKKSGDWNENDFRQISPNQEGATHTEEKERFYRGFIAFKAIVCTTYTPFEPMPATIRIFITSSNVSTRSCLLNWNAVNSSALSMPLVCVFVFCARILLSHSFCELFLYALFVRL